MPRPKSLARQLADAKKRIVELDSKLSEADMAHSRSENETKRLRLDLEDAKRNNNELHARNDELRGLMRDLFASRN
jgi:chromosome segregation ATPase